jgi:hypothetical protein
MNTFYQNVGKAMSQLSNRNSVTYSTYEGYSCLDLYEKHVIDQHCIVFDFSISEFMNTKNQWYRAGGKLE